MTVGNPSLSSDNAHVSMKLFLSTPTNNEASLTTDAATAAAAEAAAVANEAAAAALAEDAEAELRRREEALRRSYDEGLDLMTRTSAFFQQYCGRNAMPFIKEAATAAAAAAAACQQEEGEVG